MPCSHYIDPGKGVIFATSNGTVTDSDWINTLMSIARDKNFHPDLRGFSDYTGVTESLISAETIALLAANPACSPKSRWAFLIKPGLAGATIEFYQSSLRRGELEIFTDRSVALAWLNEGVPAEKRVE